MTLGNPSSDERSLVYPDMWTCKKLRAVGTIAKGCRYPNCDCGQPVSPAAQATDEDLAAAWDDPNVVTLPILPRYQP